MEEINKYIESNKLLLERRIEQLKGTSAFSDTEKDRLRHNITALRYYIMGLEHAKEYIEKESINNE
jgi:3-phenylpropionate/cinnamic acid dioxygenase small subunit